MKYREILEACWTGYRRKPGTAEFSSGSCVKVSEQAIEENLHDWFGKEKWVRMDTKGNIKGPCARGSETEGKPKCLPQAKAHALGKKGRASAAQKKRREDPNPERSGKAINVSTRVREEELDEKWSAKYKKSINCSHPKGFSQRAHCAGKRKHNESVEMEMVCEDCGMCETHADFAHEALDEACWKGYHKEGMKTMFGKRYPDCVKNKKKNESVSDSHESCPECGGAMYPDTMITEKQDACYYKVKSRYKVWPSAYASGALVQCRKKGAANWGSKSKNESIENNVDELSRILELSTGLTTDERAKLNEEFNLIESIIDTLAKHNSVDSEVIWEDLENLTDDELYVFAVTQDPIMEDWSKVNKKDHTDGMSRGAVKAYRREHPGSKLKTAVTTEPSKLKKDGKASKRRKSYCSRSKGQMNMHNISCAKTPDKAICKARRRWNC